MSRSPLVVPPPNTHPGMSCIATIETRSTAVLKTVGSYRYATDSTTEILCVAYAVDDDPVQLWIPGNPVPPEFTEAAHNPRWVLAAHGDHFETAIEQHVLAPRYGWPLIAARTPSHAPWRCRWQLDCRRG